MRIAFALTAAVAALALTGAASGKSKPKPRGPTVCTGTVTDVVKGDLVVPQGASCNAGGAVVGRRLRIERDATLIASGAFRVGRGIEVSRGATLQVVGRQIAIGGVVRAQGARKVALVREPVAGSSATVRGSVLLFRTAEVSLLSLTVRGAVLVGGGGAQGMEVGANRIARSLVVTRVRMLRPQQSRVFSIHSNTIGGPVAILDNKATGASSPPFIGGNTLLEGNLLCRRNVPAPVDTGPGGTQPNVVVRGVKRGQCAAL